jgi:hypothetical protein
MLRTQHTHHLFMRCESVHLLDPYLCNTVKVACKNVPASARNLLVLVNAYRRPCACGLKIPLYVLCTCIYKKENRLCRGTCLCAALLCTKATLLPWQRACQGVCCMRIKLDKQVRHNCKVLQLLAAP